MFKIGDRVKAKEYTPYDITTNGWEGEVVSIKKCYTVDITVSNGTVVAYDVESKYFDLITSSDEINKQRTSKMRLNSMMKRLMDPDVKKLMKAGLINGDLLLTEEGKDELTAIMFDEKKAELVKIAEEKIAEDKSE